MVRQQRTQTSLSTAFDSFCVSFAEINKIVFRSQCLRRCRAVVGILNISDMSRRTESMCLLEMTGATSTLNTFRSCSGS